jgi:hypothetical protein
VLPASQADTSPPSNAVRRDNAIVIGLIVALLVYTLLIAWGLLSNLIPPQHAYWLISLACVVPAVWYGYGYLKATDDEQSLSLLLSSVGWALAALAILIKHRIASTLPPEALAAGDETGSVWVTICAALAILCILIGALLSLHAWTRTARNAP